MAYQEQGAYTPPSEPPLSFDARQPVRGASPMPTTLIASVVLLAIVGGGGIMFLRHGAGPSASTPEVVGTQVGPTRSPPPVSTQAADPTAGLQIYTSEAPQAAAPTYVAPPETPTVRTGAPIPQIAVARAPTEIVTLAPPPAPPPVAITAPTRPTREAAGQLRIATPPPEIRAPVAAAPRPAIAAPSSTRSANAGDPIGALARATATPAVPAMRSSAGGTGTSVQIGAFSSTALAERGWNDAAAVAPGAAAGRSQRIEPVDVSGTTLYRTFMTGFANHDAAVAFCDQLRASGKACFVR